jgi:hypothetical protein
MGDAIPAGVDPGRLRFAVRTVACQSGRAPGTQVA